MHEATKMERIRHGGKKWLGWLGWVVAIAILAWEETALQDFSRRCLAVEEER